MVLRQADLNYFTLAISLLLCAIGLTASFNSVVGTIRFSHGLIIMLSVMGLLSALNLNIRMAELIERTSTKGSHRV